MTRATRILANLNISLLALESGANDMVVKTGLIVSVSAVADGVAVLDMDTALPVLFKGERVELTASDEETAADDGAVLDSGCVLVMPVEEKRGELTASEEVRPRFGLAPVEFCAVMAASRKR